MLQQQAATTGRARAAGGHDAHTQSHGLFACVADVSRIAPGWRAHHRRADGRPPLAPIKTLAEGEKAAMSENRPNTTSREEQTLVPRRSRVFPCPATGRRQSTQ